MLTKDDKPCAQQRPHLTWLRSEGMWGDFFCNHYGLKRSSPRHWEARKGSITAWLDVTRR